MVRGVDAGDGPGAALTMTVIFSIQRLHDGAYLVRDALGSLFEAERLTSDLAARASSLLELTFLYPDGTGHGLIYNHRGFTMAFRRMALINYRKIHDPCRYQE